MHQHIAGKVGEDVTELVHNIRKVMSPACAVNLKERKKNQLKDFVQVAGPLGVTHFLIFAQTPIGVNLRIIRVPRGPTLTFRVLKYSTVRAISNSQVNIHMMILAHFFVSRL